MKFASSSGNFYNIKLFVTKILNNLRMDFELNLYFKPIGDPKLKVSFQVCRGVGISWSFVQCLEEWQLQEILTRIR